MLRLSKKVEYGLMAVRYIAMHGDVSNTKEIAEHNNIPYELLAKILQQLVRKGIIASYQGARGGYGLAVGADRLSVQSVIEALEGPLNILDCKVDGGIESCILVNVCSVKKPLRVIQARIQEVFSRTSLAEIL